MSRNSSFKISYIGGGSRFVVTLLHGIASRAEDIKMMGYGMELTLMDINLRRANEMKEYADITAKQIGLNLSTIVTDDIRTALTDADWILYSVGFPAELKEKKQYYLSKLGNIHEETAPRLAVEAALLWNSIKKVGDVVCRLAPKSLFSTLVNPTDVIAPAFEKAFGIRSIGMCVEVTNLMRWLSYYLQVDENEMEIDYIGANHAGWVSKLILVEAPGGSRQQA